MKIEITKFPKSEIELKIEIPTEEWNEFIADAAAELSRDLKIEGFRPGHAPANLVEDRLGSARILEEAAEHCVQKTYSRALSNNEIQAIGKPEISVTKIAKDNPFEYKARVAMMPEVELADYKKIAADLVSGRKKVEVSEEEIKKAIDWLLKSRTKYSPVARPAQAGDRVEIDFAGECDGKKLPELCSQNHPAILGRGYFMPGFEENLLGMVENQEKSFDIIFPADFDDAKMAGKKVSFSVKMNLVQEGQMPEFSDEFVKGLGNFENAEVFKKSIKDGLMLEKQEQERERWRSELIEKIAAKSKMEMPEVLVEGEKNRIMEDLKNKIAPIGLTFEQYLDKFKKTEKELEKEFETNAIVRVKAFLVLQAMVKKENIEVSDQEIAEEVNHALLHYQNADQAGKNVDIEQLKAYTKDVLQNKKVFEKLENYKDE